MTQEESQQREENRALHEQVSLQQEQISLLRQKHGLPKAEIAVLQEQVCLLEQDLDRLRQQVQASQERLKKDSHNPTRNLLDHLSTHQDAVLTFLDNFAVPFDNSLAERDVRMVKVQQKISGCFRSLGGAQAFCRIRGSLWTLRKQGLPILTALELAFAVNLFS